MYTQASLSRRIDVNSGQQDDRGSLDSRGYDCEYWELDRSGEVRGVFSETKKERSLGYRTRGHVGMDGTGTHAKRKRNRNLEERNSGDA